jgi:type I restriction enzyme, S subunit
MSKWVKYKIGNVSDSFAGGTPSRSRPDYFNGEIPWISSSEVNLPYIDDTKEKITELGLENSSAKWIPKNSVLVAMYGATAGVVSKLLINATSNQAVLALVPYKDKIDGGFLYYQVKQNKEGILFLAQGSGQPNLSKDLIDNYEINFPISVSEQRQIATILSTADAVIEKTQAAIAKYKAIKQGMLQDLFTRGIDTSTGKLRPSYQDAPELYKDSKLGWIPREWEVERLEDLCSERPSYGINAAAADFTYQLPTYIRITDIDDNGNFSKTGRKCVNSQFSHQYILKNGDLVFARTGATVGKTYLYNEADGILVYAGFLIKVSPNQKLLVADFLKYLTETAYYLNWVGIMSQRSGQPGINGNEYGSFLVPKPKLTEQKLIAERLNSINRKLQTEQDFLQKQQQIKAGLMNDLLSGKKKVKVKEELMAQNKI